jgi:hypothetical protein
MIYYRFEVPKKHTATICLNKTYEVGPGAYEYTLNI